MKRRTDQILGHVGLVGKIDPRLDQCERFDELPPPGLGLIADQALELAESLPALRGRLRRNQIRQTLDFRQIEPPVDRRPGG